MNKGLVGRQIMPFMGPLPYAGPYGLRVPNRTDPESGILLVPTNWNFVEDLPWTPSEHEKAEVQRIIKEFSRQDQCELWQIIRVSNPELEKMYESVRSGMERRAQPTDEELVFHGTHHETISKWTH